MKTIHWRYITQQSLLFLLFIYLLLFASTHNGLVNETILTISAILFTLLGVFWAFKGFPRRSNLDWPLGVLILVLFITSLTSIDPRRSLSEFWLVGISISLFIATGDGIRRGLSRSLVVGTTLLTGAVIMLFGWMEVARWYLDWFQTTGKLIPEISFRLSTPNFFVVILNAYLMFSLSWLFSQRTWMGRIALMVYAISAIGLIYLTSSRGGWLGTAAGLGCLAVLFLIRYKRILQQFWKKTKKKKALLAAGMAFLVVLGATSGYLFYRQAMQPTHSDSIVGSRSYLWKPAWEAFLRSPIFGEGPFTYVSQYAKTRSVPPYEIFVYAHNIYLDILSGSGIVGLAAFLWFALSVVVTLIKNLKTTQHPEFEITVGAIATLAAFLVHGLLDSVHHTIPTSAWAMGMILGAAIRPETLQDKKPSIPAGVVLFSVIVLSWINIWQNHPFVKGIAAANTGDWSLAAKDLETAATRDPLMAIVWQQAGLAESQMAFGGQADELERAIGSFAKAVDLDPDWVVNQINLAALYNSQGNLEIARHVLEAALEKAPQSSVALLNEGLILEQAGALDEAAKVYEKTLILEPGWIDAYFWRENPFRAQVLSHWKEDHGESQEPALPELEKALKADPMIAASYLPLIERYIQDGRMNEAKGLLQKMRLTYFKNEEEQLEMEWFDAELMAAEGDYAGATVAGEKALNGIRYQGMYGPGTYGMSMYAPLMFRRLSMSMDWAPQVEIIRITDAWGFRLKQLSQWYLQNGEEDRSNKILEELHQAIPDFETLDLKKDG